MYFQGLLLGTEWVFDYREAFGYGRAYRIAAWIEGTGESSSPKL
jgi:hypothetical protein